MEDAIRDKIEQLTQRINELAGQQTSINRQLIQLMNELEQLKKTVTAGETVTPPPVKAPPTVIQHPEVITAPPVRTTTPAIKPITTPTVQKKTKGGLEEFVGGNIASKAGILVTIIGIFIGSKYAIDHNLVSPIVRIISGYACGLALIGIAIRLKKKYEAYSAVLMGGGLAVLYFITYIAYSFYGLWPQLVAFILMLLCTVATVYAALVYNRVIIAHLGQVTAYALPFLLSDNSGRYTIFFSYITIINAGIMVLAFRKYWKSLFNTAFVITWFIFGAWYVLQYKEEVHFYLAFAFLTIFFLLFYATFLAYKLVKKEQYAISDVIVLLSNAFIFYGLGYSLLSSHTGTEQYAGLFTIINAMIHLVISLIIRRAQLADRALYYLVLGLVIVFLTIAIPVQFNGNWVTLLWTGEALLVFLIGRTRQAGGYEKLAAGLLLLSFISLSQDWFEHLEQFTSLTKYSGITPFLNVTFFTGLLAVAAQGVMLYVHRSKKYATTLQPGSTYVLLYDYGLPVLLLITGYCVFLFEIQGYFALLNAHLDASDGSFGLWNQEISHVALGTQLLFTMMFVAIVGTANTYSLRNRQLGIGFIAATVILLVILFTQGMPMLNELAATWYQRHGSGLYFGMWNVGLRYCTISVAAYLLFTGNRTVRQPELAPSLSAIWTVILHMAIIGLLSFEYLHWAGFTGPSNQYKLGLSILWGVYALFLIITGIRNKHKMLRLTAIGVFVITLLKLFLYDLADMGTLTKTISFISLGVILLLVSYLYNRYKEVLFGDDR